MSRNRKNKWTHGVVLHALLVLCLLGASWRLAAAEESAPLWEALRSGTAFAMIRHAIAPGMGDPPNFTLGDCTTQRNLDDRGRRQAEGIGARFRKNGIARAEVFSSEWCRCQDTAEGLKLGPATTLPPLNSFFSYPERRDPQTAAIKAWLTAHRSDAPLVLVTHHVNILALTGISAGSGEIVVARLEPDGKVSVLGRL